MSLLALFTDVNSVSVLKACTQCV